MGWFDFLGLGGSNQADEWGGSGVGNIQAQGLGPIGNRSLLDTGRGTSTGGYGLPGQQGMSPFGTEIGMNLGTAQLGLSGLGALGSLWTGFQAQKLAKDQFDFTKRTTNTNLRNQTQAYNTTLDDRITSRGKVQGMNQSEVDDYLARNRISAR